MRVFLQPRALCLMPVVLTLLLAGGTPAMADVYKYSDEKGVIWLTDDLKSVPPKFRESVTVIKEEQILSRNTAPGTSPPPPSVEIESTPSATAEAQQTGSVQSTARELWSKWWVQAAVFSAAALIVLALVAKITSALSSPHLTKVIYLCFFLGVFVAGYKLYADYMANSYHAIKGKTMQIFTEANKREAPQMNEER